MIPCWTDLKRQRSSFFKILLSVFFVFVWQGQLWCAEQLNICVPPFVAEGLHPKQVEFLENTFLNELAKNDKYHIFSRNEIAAVEKSMNEPNPETRKSNTYYFYMAEKLDADRVIAVYVQKATQSNFVIMAQVLDTYDHKTLDIIIQESGGAKESFINTFSSIAQRIGGVKGPDIITPFLSRLDADIAFCSNRDGDWDIYVLEADERYPKLKTTNPTADFSPCWSPDGKKLVYSSRLNRNYEIVILDCAANEEKILTNNRVDDVTPNWGAKGDFIVYCTWDKKYKIYLLDQTTNKTRPLTKNDQEEFFPHFSPDEKNIVYSAGNPSQIYKLNLEDGASSKLLSDSGPNYNPVYSPDGAHIAFESTRDGNYEIYVMNVDGTDLKNVTNDQGDDMSPTFSPDGKWLAFASDREGNNEIYVINLDSKIVTNITQNPKDDRLPTWSLAIHNK